MVNKTEDISNSVFDCRLWFCKKMNKDLADETIVARLYYYFLKPNSLSNYLIKAC